MDGILLFNKPKSWTSHDVVNRVRKKIGQQAVGHAGTLDPMATGLLVLLLGKATKLSNALSGLDKDYQGTFRLGIQTDTLDLEGKVIAQNPDISAVTEQAIQDAFARFRGPILQTPPSFSAVKKNGKKLYELARQGTFVQVDPRPILISEFKLLKFESPEIYFFVHCSKGTYVRCLADEVGKVLGVGATLSSLSRTRIGNFYLTDALEYESFDTQSLDQIQKALRKDDYLQLANR